MTLERLGRIAFSAQALVAAGYAVDALDVRGHSDSGTDDPDRLAR